MKRLLWLMALLICSYSISSATAHAQSGWQWYQSPNGFQYVYPSDWRQDAPSAPSIEGAFGNSDHSGNVFSQSQTLTNTAPSPVAFVLDIVSQHTASPRYLSYSHGDPISISVDGADRAARIWEIYRSPAGTIWTTWTLAVQQGKTLDVLTILATGNYDLAHPDQLLSIVKSFALTQSAQPATISQPANSPNNIRSLPSSFGDGTFIIGSDIASGTYRAQGGSDCYWARLSGFGGTVSEIIANDAGHTSPIVTIRASDAGFQTSGCGTWSGA